MQVELIRGILKLQSTIYSPQKISFFPSNEYFFYGVYMFIKELEKRQMLLVPRLDMPWSLICGFLT